MAFLRLEKKKSGTCLRIVESYTDSGKPKHQTLHSLGKVEDYPPSQLESIAKKLLECAGLTIKDIVVDSFEEITRVNYGYALVIRTICTYSDKRARKDKAERDKLIAKAELRLAEPGKYKQVKKKGSGRFISTDEDGSPIKLNIEKIEQNAKYDGFKNCFDNYKTQTSEGNLKICRPV